MSNCHCFRRIAAELSQLNAAREAAMLDAFVEVEVRDPTLATLLLQRFGERSRAARWMSSRQRAFGGLCAYELLADGDVDPIWDELSGSAAPEVAALERGAAY